MAKKQKRRVSKSTRAEARPASRPAVAAPAPAAAPSTSAPATTSSVRSSSSSEFNPDYSYVIQDLKRIGIMAAAFISILVVLSFFLK